MVVALALIACLALSGCAEERPVGRTPPPPCPDRMALLPDLDVCIDRYEAVVEGRGAAARALPVEGRLPTTEISWFDADRACRQTGFRLCSRDEWQHACSGTAGEGGRAFPYGDEYEPGRCNTVESDTPISEFALAPAGAHERCVTPEGVYDLTGNLAEWLGTADPTGLLREMRGGTFGNQSMVGRCVTNPLVYQPPEVAFEGLGVRCCADAR